MSVLDFNRPITTRDGRPVEILTTKGRGIYPVLGYVGDSINIKVWSADGCRSKHSECGADLINPPKWNLRSHIAKHFRALQENEVPHREDFTEAMLEGGWRPLLLGEIPVEYEYNWSNTVPNWVQGYYTKDRMVDQVSIEKSGDRGGFCRTKRPLPPLRKRVPLEASDVPPGSVFRCTDSPAGVWLLPVQVNTAGVGWSTGGFCDWLCLRSGWEIKRPGEDWQHASKEVDA